jgi:hypothetical protein
MDDHSLRFKKDLYKLIIPKVHPLKSNDPFEDLRFVISYLLLQIITLKEFTDFELMSVIPELPDSYTSDPHLSSFLKLLIEGLSLDRSLRPSIDCY